jgi:hypothetical protein
MHVLPAHNSIPTDFIPYDRSHSGQPEKRYSRSCNGAHCMISARRLKSLRQRCSSACASYVEASIDSLRLTWYHESRDNLCSYCTVSEAVDSATLPSLIFRQSGVFGDGTEADWRILDFAAGRLTPLLHAQSIRSRWV